jgi:hypothetical protein
MEKASVGRRSFLGGLALVVALAGFVIVALLLIPQKESETLYQTAKPAGTKTEIPPIDANAPARTKTATFAMG